MTPGKLPDPAAEALKKAAKVEPTKADPLARLKAIERAEQMARTLYPSMFKKDGK